MYWGVGDGEIGYWVSGIVEMSLSESAFVQRRVGSGLSCSKYCRRGTEARKMQKHMYRGICKKQRRVLFTSRN